MLGGAWFPLGGWMRTVGEYLPSYWITNAGRVAIGGDGWPVKGWLVVGCWQRRVCGAGHARLPGRHQATLIPPPGLRVGSSAVRWALRLPTVP